MKYPRRSTLTRVAVYGGLIVLAASIWAWAVGAAVWLGVVGGGVLDLVSGILGFKSSGFRQGFCLLLPLQSGKHFWRMAGGLTGTHSTRLS